jgi:hypothetical protein
VQKTISVTSTEEIESVAYGMDHLWYGCERELREDIRLELSISLFAVGRVLFGDASH